MNTPQKSTKIVATIGPATSEEHVLKEMIEAGMNVARFNTKHADPAWHEEHIRRVLKVATELQKSIAILVDLQGPEIRVDLPQKKSFPVKKGDRVTFTSDTKTTKPKSVIVPQMVIDSLEKMKQIVLEDGACDFTVVSKAGDSLEAIANVDSDVNDRKTMNTPGTILNMPSLTQRDFGYIDHINPSLIDYVGLSFVRNKQDIEILQKELDKRKCKAEIIAKIENQSAIDNIDSIIEVADAVMIARGDLGVEVPFEQLIHWQKTIIAKCRTAAKPVITATEMLQTMIENPRPTRAEVSDVAHAVYDGTDAVMLSGETTTGKYPVKSVATQATIARFNEPHAHPIFEYVPEFDAGSAISMSAISIHENSSVDISKIICLTETGKTARLLSRFHPGVPIVALTSNDQTVRKLALSYGVTSYKIEVKPKNIDTLEEITEICKHNGIVQVGETILVIYGMEWKQPGHTNSLSLVTVS